MKIPFLQYESTMRIITTYVTASLIFFFFSTTARSQNVGSIKGKVLNKATKQNIHEVNIFLSDSKNKTHTDTSGIFSFKNLKEGNYSLTIKYEGFKEKIVNDVFVLPGKSTYVEIEIEESHLDLSEVTITADKYENTPLTPVSTYTFSREEISTNPGAQGDIFRALGMLPGVSSSGGEYSAIAVRGQGTRDNVYMVDDIPIMNLSHLEGNVGGFNDPNGGRFSIFAPRVVNDAQFQAGGFGAEYGRRSASYLGLRIKEGSKEDYTVDGQLDLLGVTANYEGPSYILDNTSLFISARYQNFGPVVSVINRHDAGLPIYGDFIFKSATQIGGASKLSLIAIVSPESYVRDVSNVRADKDLNLLLLLDGRTNKNIFGANLTTLTSDNSYWKNVLYFTRTTINNNYGEAYPVTDSNGHLLDPNNIPSETGVQIINYSESEFGFRSFFSIDFANKSSLTAGIDGERIDLKNYRNLSRPDTLYVFGPNDSRPSPTTYYGIVDPKYYNAQFDNFGYNGSAYVDYSFLLFKELTLNTGVRYDYTGFADEHTFSPRLSGSYQLDEANSINFSAGLYYQDPIYSEIADQPAGKKLLEEKIAEYIFGVKSFLSPDLKLTVEGWYKKLDNLVVRPFADESEQNNSGTGWAGGFDVNLTKRLSEGVHGTIGYSYMQSKRNDNDGLGEYDFSFSQPHQFSMLIGYKPDETWILSGKFRYSTGKPTDKYIIHSNIFNNPYYIRYSEEIIGKNADRLSDFISLDLRADYRFQVKGMALSLFMDVLNVLNRQNQYIQFLNTITGKVFYDGLAIFPTFGLKFEF